MNKERISYKGDALSSLSRGEWKKALQSFQKHCDQEPTDLRSRLKKAELLERLGKKKEAIEEYRKVAESYGRDGFLLQAISVNKMILRIDPFAKDVNARLAQLYTEKSRESKHLRPLPHIPLFSDLSEQELRSMLDLVQSKSFPKDTFICREGEAGDSLMIICRGEVGIYKQSLEGGEIWIRSLGEGDCLGEFGFFLDRKRHASVKSLMECETIEITRNELDGIIKTHPRVKEVLEDLFEKRVLDNLLALSPLFSPLTVPERREVLKRFCVLNIPEETFVFKGGEPSHCLYMIQSGEVEIFIQSRRGKRVVLGRLGSGHLFGEIGVLLNTPRMAFVMTTQPSKLLELAKEDFDDLLRLFPKLQSVVKEISSKRLSRMNEILSQESVEKAKESMV
ncbi:MAG: cyclic nucleotide-binding domain-containing protein [Deltaproteobacteria bacterium]|nr:cyclic nucleotide-binding domain-containing protein [Deltaproteobacteria bacterium]